MAKQNKLLNFIKDYFYGSKTAKFFNVERCIYNNHILDEEELDRKIRISNIEEMLYAVAGRGIANGLSLSALGYYLVTNEIPSWVFFGETLRISAMYTFSAQRRKKEIFFQELESGKYERDKIKSSTKKVKN